jgi:hypothetical protein
MLVYLYGRAVLLEPCNTASCQVLEKGFIYMENTLTETRVRKNPYFVMEKKLVFSVCPVTFTAGKGREVPVHTKCT